MKAQLASNGLDIECRPEDVGEAIEMLSSLIQQLSEGITGKFGPNNDDLKDGEIADETRLFANSFILLIEGGGAVETLRLNRDGITAHDIVHEFAAD